MSMLCDRLMHAAGRNDRGRDGILSGSPMNGPRRRDGGIETRRGSHDPLPASDRDADVPRHAGTIVPIVMRGDSGTRLWEASREGRPKQFIPRLDDLSDFRITARRFDHATFGKPLVPAGNDMRFVVAEQLAAVGVGAEIVLKPMHRDSTCRPARCIASPTPAGSTSR